MGMKDGCGASPLLREGTNDVGREDGRLGTCPTNGCRSGGVHSPPAVCTFGVRGCGAWIAPCAEDDGAGGIAGYENGACCSCGADVCERGWPFRRTFSGGEGLASCWRSSHGPVWDLELRQPTIRRLVGKLHTLGA